MDSKEAEALRAGMKVYYIARGAHDTGTVLIAKDWITETNLIYIEWDRDGEKGWYSPDQIKFAEQSQ